MDIEMIIALLEARNEPEAAEALSGLEVSDRGFVPVTLINRLTPVNKGCSEVSPRLADEFRFDRGFR